MIAKKVGLSPLLRSFLTSEVYKLVLKEKLVFYTMGSRLIRVLPNYTILSFFPDNFD